MENQQPSSETDDQALRSWRKLAVTLQGITPAGYLRLLLIITAAAGILWVIWQTREALFPFILGGVIAYILLPLVNFLDRVMPRFLAVLISLVIMVGGLALIIYALIPPLFSQAPAFLQLLPDRAEIQQSLDRLRGVVETLPAPTREAILRISLSVSTTLRQYFDQNLGALPNVLVTFLIGIFNSIGFILGLLIVPAWLLNVLKDQPKGIATLNNALPASIRKDFWALAKIIDRPLRAFVSGQFLLAIATGIAVYLALTILEMLGWPVINYKVPLALWAAVFALIPEIGPYLGAIPAVLGGFIRGPQEGVTIIGVYILLHYLVNQLVGSRIENRMTLRLHPVMLLIFLVALGQLGFFWIFLATPVVSILLNLFLYLNGRLSNPPLPAGVLPGQPVPKTSESLSEPARRIPLSYRRSRAARRS